MDTPRESHQRVRESRGLIAASFELPVIFDSAEGCTVRDSSGREYLDLISGYGVVNAGWKNQAILEAMRCQMDRACFAPPWAATGEGVELAQLLLGLLGERGGEYICLRATGGGDALEGVLRMIRHGTGRQRLRLLTLGRAYHGGGTVPLGLSDGRSMPLPQLEGDHVRIGAPYCLRCPWKLSPQSCGLACAAAAEQAMDASDRIDAMIVEPVLGAGGAIVPPPGYLARIARAAKERGIFLIVDEVMTGFGRTGAMLAHRAEAVAPDAIILGKGLSSGYMPIGAALVRRTLCDRASRQDVSSTFAWTPLACAAARANIEFIKEANLCSAAARAGTVLMERLVKEIAILLGEHCGEIRGRGLMAGIEIVRNRDALAPDPRLAERIAYHLHKLGVLVGIAWTPHILMIMPPLTINTEQIERGIDLLAAAVERALSVRTAAVSGRPCPAD
jgi:4-aminobutyrate aminotransferase / (S)-3-amino-2-methylpropionate transaminase / 5-aminovalerate transaminase